MNCLNCFVQVVKGLSQRRRTERQARRPQFERLEGREMLATVGATKWAAVDFSETVLNSQAMEIGGYGGDLAQPESETNLHPRTASSFHSLFNSSRPWLDMNGDGVVWGPVDGQLAIDAIMKKVQQDFSPYDLRAFTGDFAVNRGILTDGIVGDGIVLVTGDSSFIPNEGSLFGHSPPADRILRRKAGFTGNLACGQPTTRSRPTSWAWCRITRPTPSNSKCAAARS